jgi:hypothetical protein
MKLLTLPLIFAGGLIPAAASWSVGHLALRKQELPGILKFAIGAALLSTAIFFLGIAGYAERYAFFALALVCLAPVYKGLRIEWRTPLAALALLYLVYALAPEIQSDAMNYHLALPQQMLQTGFLTDHRGFYDVLPQGLEMLFAFAMAIGGPSAAKLLHLVFFIATLPLIFALARRLELPEWCAPTASLLYFAAPVCAVSGTAGYNDAAEVFFVLAVCLLAEKHPMLAGISAGFCYSIKISGLIILPPALLFYAWRRDWSKLAWFAAGAAAMIAPWMVRAFQLTGNPLAPLFNRFFPNPYFYIISEQNMSQWLRNYGTVAWWQMPIEVTLRGERLQGLIGPGFLAIPVALLALRHRAGRLLLAAAALLLPLWIMNAGARFLMPALPFFALAIVLALPRRIAWGVALVQTALCLPPVLALWSADYAWRLRGFPLAAALRIEPAEQYLKETLPEYSFAKLAEANTPPQARILDMAGLPALYLPRETVSAGLSAEGLRLMEVIVAAMNMERGVFSDLSSSWPETQIAALRIRLPAGRTAQWSIGELQLLNGEAPVNPEKSWDLDAWPNIWETPRAFDRNVLTPWSTREPAREGMYFQVDFGKPIALTGINVVSLANQRASNAEIFGQDASGAWRKLGIFSAITPREAANLRPTASRTLKRAGVQYIAAPATEPASRSFQENKSDWNMDLAVEAEGLDLFHLR